MRNPYEEDVLSTDWSTMTVGQMWAAIGEFDRRPASEQSGGWNRAFELLDAHRARLEEYRDLAERSWHGPTADAFLKQVNELISAVVVARDAAVANEPVLPHLSSSMVEARAALAPLHAKWAANQARAAAGGAPPTVGGMQRGAQSPVPDDVLHRQAVSVMQTLSSRLLEGYRAMRIPPIYDPQFHIDPGLTHPTLPPGGDHSGGNTRSSPPAHASPITTSGNTSSSSNPALAGTPGMPTLSGPSSQASAPAVPVNSGTPPTIGPFTGIVAPEGVGGFLPGRSSGAEPQWSRPGTRALPPGGVINAPPEGMPLERPAIRTSKVNPVGGVIGPTTGRETEGMFGPAVGGASGRPTERRLGRNREYDSDEHWPTPKGVPPVLGLPGPEPVHDPGMPVIGMPTENRDPRKRREE
jgi:hypothetical protein